ncbi:MAG: TRAP transporter small permease [Deltaproteobacteria bacterium]|nr:TRAP transporter small permease [Deltaproteobacteria bacterium]
MSKSSPFAKALTIVDRIVFHIEEKVVAVSVIGLALVLITNVTLRFFNSSLPSTEELSQFLMFFITFLGTSYAARSGMNIRMSMVSDALKGKAKKALTIFVCAGTAIIMFYVAYLSWRYVMKIASLHRVSPILQVPVQYVWIIMPIGMFLTGVQYSLALGRNLVSKGSWLSYSVPMEQESSAFSDFEEKLLEKSTHAQTAQAPTDADEGGEK